MILFLIAEILCKNTFYCYSYSNSLYNMGVLVLTDYKDKDKDIIQFQCFSKEQESKTYDFYRVLDIHEDIELGIFNNFNLKYKLINIFVNKEAAFFVNKTILKKFITGRFLINSDRSLLIDFKDVKAQFLIERDVEYEISNSSNNSFCSEMIVDIDNAKDQMSQESQCIAGIKNEKQETVLNSYNLEISSYENSNRDENLVPCEKQLTLNLEVKTTLEEQTLTKENNCVIKDLNNNKDILDTSEKSIEQCPKNNEYHFKGVLNAQDLNRVYFIGLACACFVVGVLGFNFIKNKID